jgi:hypothetical protein
MPAHQWTNAYLDRMRLTGDDTADGVIREVFETRQTARLHELFRHLQENDDPLPGELPARVREYLEETDAPPPRTEPIEKGAALFTEHGPAILILLGCYSLPTLYAAGKGVKVLRASGFLALNPVRRVFETTQMVLDTMRPGGLTDRNGRGVRTCQKVRLMHAAIRRLLLSSDDPRWETERDGVPINQEHMAGTLMTFAVLVPWGLRRMRLRIAAEQIDGWFAAWRYIGRLLGIRPELIPESFERGEELARRILARMIEPTEDSRVVEAALLQSFDKPFPWWLKGRLASITRFFLYNVLEDDRRLRVADAVGVPRRPFRDWRFRFYLTHAPEFQRFRVLKRFSLGIIQMLVDAERGGGRAEFRIPEELSRHWSERDAWGLKLPAPLQR